ncbi:MAG: hypothetical protein KBT27_06590 [Prevotellaceae bacterium]|nr:hypothetical protein [Candidatus Faecinaster equi]
MKKRLFALCTAIMLAATPVMADIPDISGLSLEELLSLRDLVAQAIVDNGGDYIMPGGIYEVGKDIKEGAYIFHCPEDAFTVSVAVFDDYDTYKAYETEVGGDPNKLTERQIVHERIYPEDFTRYSVKEGQFLYLSSDTIVSIETLPFAP